MVLSDDDAILFGGWAGQGKEPNSAVAFALQDKMKGEGAEENKDDWVRSDYCMTLRTSDMQWVRNRYVGVPASKRYGHSATAIGPHLIIIGGWDGGKPLNDVVVLRDRSVTEKANEPLFGGEEEGLGDGDYGGDFGLGDEDFGKGDDWTLDTGA
jgi:hypothetical protein